MLGAFNVKTDLPLVDMFHAFTDEFWMRFANQVRETDQVYSTGTNLQVTPGIPTLDFGPHRMTYDGTLGTLRGLNGFPLDPFDLPILP